jgi:hypothetical protein
MIRDAHAREDFKLLNVNSIIHASRMWQKAA